MDLDDEIIHHAMERFNISKEEVEKQLQELVDMGLLQRNDNPIMPAEFRITNSGSKLAEEEMIKKYGEFKKVIDHNGIAYRVPTIVIIREGIKEQDLYQFPLWSDKNG